MGPVYSSPMTSVEVVDGDNWMDGWVGGSTWLNRKQGYVYFASLYTIISYLVKSLV
jgi:hypothetical protein